jgi:hypothetical protein
VSLTDISKINTYGFLVLLRFLIDEMNIVLNKGESVMRMWIGPKLMVFPLDAEAVRVITSSTTEIDKGDDYGFLEQWLGQALLTGTGDYWFKMRRMATPAFHFAKLEEYVEVMDSNTRVGLFLRCKNCYFR